MNITQQRRNLTIFDTTLRDGDQAAGFAFLPEQKIELAKALDAYGVDIIEAGFPCSSPSEADICAQIAALGLNAQIAVMCRCIPEEIKQTAAVFRGMRSHKRIIHLSLPASDIQMKTKLHKKPEEILYMVDECVRLAATLCDTVEMGIEDASRADRVFLADFCSQAIESGARIIDIADTTGSLLPDEMAAIVRFLTEEIPGLRTGQKENSVALSVHCHNDMGLALASSLACIEAGADQVEVTAGGIGERAGNVPLEELAHILSCRSDVFQVNTHLHPEQTQNICDLLFSYTGTSFSPLKPVTGYNANSHASGLHQQGLSCDDTTYISHSVEQYGLARRRIILSRHSGRAGVMLALKNLFGTLPGSQDFLSKIDTIFDTIKKTGSNKSSLSITELCNLMYECNMISIKPLAIENLSESLTEYPISVKSESITGYTGLSGKTKYRVYQVLSINNTHEYAIEQTGADLELLRQLCLLDAENAYRLQKKDTGEKN